MCSFVFERLVMRVADIPDGLVVGKKYQIDWAYGFSISNIEYYQNQGFDSEKFCKKQDECRAKEKTYSKFEFLGMGFHPSGHFHCSFAKVKILDDVILIPHQCLKRNNK